MVRFPLRKRIDARKTRGRHTVTGGPAPTVQKGRGTRLACWRRGTGPSKTRFQRGDSEPKPSVISSFVSRHSFRDKGFRSTEPFTETGPVQRPVFGITPSLLLYIGW